MRSVSGLVSAVVFGAWNQKTGAGTKFPDVTHTLMTPPTHTHIRSNTVRCLQIAGSRASGQVRLSPDCCVGMGAHGLHPFLKNRNACGKGPCGLEQQGKQIGVHTSRNSQLSDLVFPSACTVARCSLWTPPCCCTGKSTAAPRISALLIVNDPH